ncbi:MAG: UbiA-like polyprenyltransferase [Candidatus Omnitrophota bacterium]
MKNIARKFAVFLEMIKWEHSVFALPFAYLGLFLAEHGRPRLSVFLWVTAAMVSFRTMAMAANRLVDARIDAENPRTRGRAIPAGLLGRPFAVFAAVLSGAFFFGSAAVLGPLCLALSPFPVLLAWFYPWAKRFTWLSHFILGMILAIAPYGAWIASCGRFSWVPAFLSAGVMAWAAGFDMIYALQDVGFDRQHGLFSFPARFGVTPALKAALVLQGFCLAAWFAAGQLAGLGWIYSGGLIAAAVFIVRQHWLIRSCGLAKMDEAFFTMNAAVSVGVFLAAAVDLSF